MLFARTRLGGMPLFRIRSGSLALVCAVVAYAACSQSQPPASTTRKPTTGPVELAAFIGRYDPATRKLTFERAAPTDPNALTVLQPYFDGAPGSPDNTFEMVTVGAMGTDTNGCGTGLLSFYGTVRLQSYFTNQVMQNVWVEVEYATPTDFHGCTNVATPPVGLSNANGLWSYGTLGVKGGGSDVVDRRWDFHYDGSTAFTFHGRVMGTLSAPSAPTGNVGFNWTPTSLVNPPRSFQVQGTTIGHIVWNGTRFYDEITTANFNLHTGGSSPVVSPGLDDPAQPYVTFPYTPDGSGNATSSSYWVEEPDTLHGSLSHLNLTGNFTACAKFKPGTHPSAAGSGYPMGLVKTIISQGDPMLNGGTIHEGWALMQMSVEYCFHYRTPDDNLPASSHYTLEVMSPIRPGPPATNNALPDASPQLWTYDYICGGRNGGGIPVGAHGAVSATWTTDETGAFSATAHPLTIGAMSDGLFPAQDLGVYEVIIDSRAASPDVFRDIIDRAEGRVLPGAASAQYQTTNTDGTVVAGADNGTYTVPPYATLPVSTDGSGLLDAGKVVAYSHPLTENTSTLGFCLGAQVDAEGAWSTVSGTIVSFTDPGVMLQANPVTWDGFFFVPSVPLPQPEADATWADRTSHKYMVCGTHGATNRIDIYLDGSTTPFVTSIGGGTDPLSNFSDATWWASHYEFGMGGVLPTMAANGRTALTGARVRRVWLCANPDPSLCP